MNDELRPARGCAYGLVISGLLWVAIFATAAVIVARCLP